MSFPSFIQISQINITPYYIRKERDSFMARCNNFFSHSFKERTSAFTSKASMTVEAAFSVSFFFIAIMCLICLFEIMALQIEIKSAMHSVGKEMAVEAYWNPLLFPSKVENEIVKTVGTDRLENSMVVGGSKGIDCSASKMYSGTTIMELCAYYQIEIPVFMFRIPIIAREEVIRVKGWSGQEEAYASTQKREMVYVTERGTVYHKELSCTYLELSINTVPVKNISGIRNENGGKYSPCEVCGDKLENQKNVYITDYGTRYHTSLECSGIDRNIYVIPLSKVSGLGGCSKCVK